MRLLEDLKLSEFLEIADSNGGPEKIFFVFQSNPTSEGAGLEKIFVYTFRVKFLLLNRC